MVHHGFREMEENGIILHQGNEYIANRDRDRIIGDDAERPGDHGASCMVHHGFQEMEENGIILHQGPRAVSIKPVSRGGLTQISAATSIPPRRDRGKPPKTSATPPKLINSAESNKPFGPPRGVVLLYFHANLCSN
ncbi:uncharacterized protein LOC105700573 isoform X2 [Orussus abietinus]|uniref:uncharacterized protein LOC105700573 isoform X2 n=1 Tax=Orussus abietinus TaxID=222816 RepID=UPI000626DE88|nr:uncharacterized protein LOC105700573 isoform X2 [Orussus abietinus]